MSEYKIEVLKKVQKELFKLPIHIQKQVSNRIEALKYNPYPDDVKKLKNTELSILIYQIVFSKR